MKMISKWRVSKMASIGMVIVLMFVLSACGKQAISSENSSTDSSQQAQGAVISNAPKTEVMSPKERELGMFFRGLLQMDNRGELMITKEQAVSLLPLVIKSTEDGEITPENQQKMMDLLTKEQKTFLDDMTARFKQFSNNRNNSGGTASARPALTDEQRAQFQKDRAQLTDEQQKKLQESRGQGKGNQGQGNGGFGGNFGANVEQQLIDLLDSKVNN